MCCVHASVVLEYIRVNVNSRKPIDKTHQTNLCIRFQLVFVFIYYYFIDQIAQNNYRNKQIQQKLTKKANNNIMMVAADVFSFFNACIHVFAQLIIVPKTNAPNI